MDIKSQSVYDYYDILEEIGTGAFGVVHRCRERKTGNIFAAKFIPVAHNVEKELIRKEIDIMNQLHHPKLINLHDAFEDEDEMVLIFELYVYIINCVFNGGKLIGCAIRFQSVRRRVIREDHIGRIFNVRSGSDQLHATNMRSH